MNKGNFKQLVRTLRNWKNEGVQIKEDKVIIPKRGKSPNNKVQRQTNDNLREK